MLSDHCGLMGLSGFQIVRGNGLSFSGEKAQSEKLGQEGFSNSGEEILNKIKIGFLFTVTQSLKGFLAKLLSKVNDLPYSVGSFLFFAIDSPIAVSLIRTVNVPVSRSSQRLESTRT